MSFQRLTNRQAAERLRVTPKHIARACAARGIQRDAQGYYLFPLDTPPDAGQTEPGPAHPPTGPAVASPSAAGPALSGPSSTAWEPSKHGRPFRLLAFISDVHVPDHDPFAVRAWLKWVRDRKPDTIVLGGDILELESCSGHGGNIHSAPLFTHEIEQGNAFLDDVQEAAPDAAIHYLEGNHETRLHRKVDSMIPTLTGALDLRELLRLSERGISWHSYGSVFFPSGSKLGCTHGTRHNDHHAKAHLASYGTSIVYGHTHRAQLYTQGFANNRLRGAFGAPCMRGLDVGWIKGPTGWSQGFVVAHLFPDGHFTVLPVLMDQQRFVEGGTLYDGRA